MSAKDKKKGSLVPRLRFPEFNGEWRSQPLGELAFIIKEKAGDRKCILMSIMSGVGLIPQIDKFGKEIAGQQYKNYIILHKNDFAYNKSSTKEYPEGFIAMYIGTEIAAVPNSIFTCFKIKVADIAHLYLNYLFLYNFHGKYLRRYITIGARSHGALAIDDADLLSLPIPYPTGNTSFKEQQRIADCLSSLDERIAAETNKLDALKAHKKGLLKQLFPAEGETLPALRFPEFRSAGEWEERTLSQLGELVSGLTYSPDDVRDNGLLVLRSSNVQNGMIVLDDNVYVRHEIGSANPSEPNDILICVRNGSKSLIGKNALIPEGMPPCTHGAFMMVFRSRSAKFVIQLFQTETYESQVSAGLGATINSINGNQLKKYKFFVPKPAEQQKIADCLSSLDELIAAQRQKLSLLKTHKKGLMQQLFPVFDEAKA
ncbi:restriction endonuclease subunit S [Desulfovibrio sp.]|uniref:restriction endonuclease subunit S n=1 Tax=Desulfovibrio sp. TaxID=885 RepID=UPI0025BD3A48|nr:restriction endonuclease subunit S [Desulfovibrio sp.]